jgi:hypothetical protein
MNKICFDINGGAKVHTERVRIRMTKFTGFLIILLLLNTPIAFAQGSIFGIVRNSNASTPANGEITFYGFLDNTDEEIRLETSVGAGYDAGNWFDDFQNYLTEAPGNPYSYRFFNAVNGEAAVLSKTIPSNSFQQEDITLAAVSWPASPSGMASRIISATSAVISWTRIAGLTYHVYRRPASSDGSFFRIDDATGLLTNIGVADSFFVDNGISGGGSYQYLLIARDGSGNLGAHSAILTVNSAVIEAPVIAAINPNSGPAAGGTSVTITGTGFDRNGTTVTIGTGSLTSVAVVSPYQITGITPIGSAGTANVTVNNTASGISSVPLTGGFIYLGNTAPVLAAIGPRATTENINLNFNITAVDPEGTTPILSTSALPGTATFTDNLNGTGTFNWTPSYTDAGSYPITFTASDGSLTATEIVTITVNEAGNQFPVLAAIGPRSVAEGANLNFQITASDPDATVPSLSATNLPINATFVDNTDGTGIFNFNPDLSQAGDFSVTFKAFDGALVDSEVVVITVTNTNQSPVLAAIGPQTTTENINLHFVISASDPDGTTPVLTTSTLPAGVTFIDNNDGTGSFDWIPNYTQAGTYPITFNASDGIATVSEIVSITVDDAGNQRPVLDSIRALTVAEGQTLARTVTTSDPDGTFPVLSTVNLPANATFVDNGNGTGSFSFTPSYSQSGIYPVIFIASDGVLADSELVTITVTEIGNQPPVISHANDTTINENDSLIIVVRASDPEGSGITLTASPSLPHYSFVDSGNGVGVFRAYASYRDAGAYFVRFMATDNGSPRLSSSDTVNITIIDINQPPTMPQVGPFAVAAGRTLSFIILAVDSTDPDPLHNLSLTVSNPPANATFTDNGNGTGTFSFTPVSAQAGTVTVGFIATDEGTPRLSSEMTVTITVYAQNSLPTYTLVPNYGLVKEGDTLRFLIRATDADGQIPVISLVKSPAHSSIFDSGNGSAVFTFVPSYVQAGLHYVQFAASDGIDTKYSKPIIIQVTEAGNQPPTITPIAVQTITEGDSLNLTINAYDPDEVSITIGADSLPVNATFTYGGNGLGTLIFKPSYVQNGTYRIYIIATDGFFVDTAIVTINVLEAGNQTPILTHVGTNGNDTVRTSEMQLLSFTVVANDPDLNFPALSATILPTGATFLDNGNGTGTFSWQTNNFDSGTYAARFFAVDSLNPALFDSLMVTIIVKDTNLVPRFFIPNQNRTVNEGQTITYRILVADPDSTIPIIQVNTPEYNLAANMSFIDSGNGVGVLTFSPDYTQGAVSPGNFYYIQWKIVDAKDPNLFILSTPPTQFIVLNANQPPVVTAVTNDTTIMEGQTLTFRIFSLDADDPLLRPLIWYDTATFPAGATLTGLIPSDKRFTFTPSYTQAGIHRATFYCTDGSLRDTTSIQITVLEAGNWAPVFTTILADTQAVVVGATLINKLVATDAENEAITITADAVINYASFIDSGNGVAVYVYQPLALVGAISRVVFIAQDINGAADTIITHYRVVEFLRGDANSDGRLDGSDVMFIVNYLYRGGKAPVLAEAADINADRKINMLDTSYLLNYFYRQGPPPPQ